MVKLGICPNLPDRGQGTGDRVELSILNNILFTPVRGNLVHRHTDALVEFEFEKYLRHFIEMLELSLHLDNS